MICCAFMERRANTTMTSIVLVMAEASFTFPPTFGVTQGLFTAVRKQPRGVYMDGDAG